PGATRPTRTLTNSGSRPHGGYNRPAPTTIPRQPARPSRPADVQLGFLDGCGSPLDALQDPPARTSSALRI
ncbi:hypothetical protein ACIBJE_11660, partial [Micromonospora sp. NPDC050187]|uniref:hypothetical protein n=1 Tax=Micromonospora sp. NPDC050187 TaxID=3364277 RepID=UPI0037B03BC7